MHWCDRWSLLPVREQVDRQLLRNRGGLGNIKTALWLPACGYISFGLISIPIRLFKAARSERVALKQVYKVAPEDSASPQSAKGRGKKAEEEEAIAPVRRVASTGESDEIVPPAKVLKGFEFEEGRFVTIEPEELKALEAKTATEMEVLEFVKLEEVDPVYFEMSYYVRPEPGGKRHLRFCLRHCGARAW